MTKQFRRRVAGIRVLSGVRRHRSPRRRSPADTYAAIRANDLPRLKSLIGSAADANAPGEFGSTPLMQAAIAGSTDAMTLLLDAGADVNAQNAFGTTALMMSVAEIDKVRLLLARGANVKATSKQGRTRAVRRGDGRVLVRSGRSAASPRAPTFASRMRSATRCSSRLPPETTSSPSAGWSTRASTSTAPT